MPASVESIDRIHELVEQLCGTDVAHADRIRLESALVEVAANVVEHGTAGAGEVTMQVQLGCHPDRLEALVLDDAAPAEVHLDTAMPGTEAESGRGLALARALCDELVHEWRDGYNRWTLVCRRA